MNLNIKLYIHQGKLGSALEENAKIKSSLQTKTLELNNATEKNKKSISNYDKQILENISTISALEIAKKSHEERIAVLKSEIAESKKYYEEKIKEFGKINLPVIEFDRVIFMFPEFLTLVDYKSFRLASSLNIIHNLMSFCQETIKRNILIKISFDKTILMK